MVFINYGRNKSATKGRGIATGEASFESQSSRSAERESRNPDAENLLITVGNDQFRDRHGDRISGRVSPPAHQRLGPRGDTFDRSRERDAVHRPEDYYRHDEELYGQIERHRHDRDKEWDHDRHKELYNRGTHVHPEEREYGDRRGLGATGEHQFTSASSKSKKVCSRLHSSSQSPEQVFPVVSSVQSSDSSRPLKSILKRKDQQDSQTKSRHGKLSGLPGIAHYMDDIEDEDKYLYGDNDKDSGRHGGSSTSKQQLSSEPELRHSSMRSAAGLWQQSVPEKSVSGVLPEFVRAQHSYTEPSGGQVSYQSQQKVSSSVPVSEGEGLWRMLTQSVEVVQQHPQPQNLFPIQLQQQNQMNLLQGGLQLAAQFPITSQPSIQPATLTHPVVAHDHTIENILKSIGFDFEMSKRMQEKAKQNIGELSTTKVFKSDDPQFGINQTASFFGSQLLQEEMRSKLGAPPTDKSVEWDVSRNLAEQSNLSRHLDQREHFDYHGQQDIVSRESQRENDPPRGETIEKLQRGCSPVSDDGSPPPIFNFPPITIKGRSILDLNHSQGWDRSLRSISNSPGIESGQQKPKSRSKSPGWIASQGQRNSPVPRSYSPVRKRSPPASGRSPVQRSLSPDRNHSPVTRRRKSPIIMRTFNIGVSPIFRRHASPVVMQKSPIMPRSRSPVRQRSQSPFRRNSRTPIRRLSRSPIIYRIIPGRKSSRSPISRKRSRSPGNRNRTSKGIRPRRSQSPGVRRHSLSPRGRKRGYSPRSSRSRSRERKMRRSTSRERLHGSGGAGRGTLSGDRASGSRQFQISSRSPRIKRSLSLSSDSDPDGPANKEYFTSPLRVPGRQYVKSVYDDKLPVHGQSASNFTTPPQQQMYDPPHAFSLVMPPTDIQPTGMSFTSMPPTGMPQTGMQPAGTSFTSMPPTGMSFTGMPPTGMSFTSMPHMTLIPTSMPPPGIHLAPTPYMMAANIGPPPGYGFSPSGPQGIHGQFSVPPPNMMGPMPAQNIKMAPQGTIKIPPHIPSASSNLKTLTSNKFVLKPENTNVTSTERQQKDIGSDISISSEKNTDNNRTFPSATMKSKAEEQKIKASASQRIAVIGEKRKSVPKNASFMRVAQKKANVTSKRQVIREKDALNNNIKLLETEYNNLKKQEDELMKRPSGKDIKQDPILAENNKLLKEIREKISKLRQQKRDLGKKNAPILKEVQSISDLRIIPKEITPKKDEEEATVQSETGESQEFKIEKGHLMKHLFVDRGQHWCKGCKIISPNIHEYVQHLSSYKHKQTLSLNHRPWRQGLLPHEGMIINKNGIKVSLPGTEFLMPVQGYYCMLCKVFLGDVSCGVDHFRCESHYLNYKKYCNANPIYERKYKEDKAAFLTEKFNENKKTDSAPKILTIAEVREQEKKKKLETESRMDDVGESIRNDDKPKGHVKCGPNDKTESEIASEKGVSTFKQSRPGEHPLTEGKLSEEQVKDISDESPNETREKGKINFNLNLSEKNIISKSGAPKRTSLLPPWQPVGKKASGSSANLEVFLTSTTGDGKIPVITDKPEKKKINAKEILEAFTDRKEKENQTNTEPEISKDTRTKNIVEANTDNAKKSKAQLKAEIEKRMMGINPDEEVPLADIKPPSPRSQNVPLPDQKPSSTFAGQEVHKVYHTDNISAITILNDIPLDKYKTTGNENIICSEKIEKTKQESVTEAAQNMESESINCVEETVKAELEILTKIENNSEKAENNESANKRIVPETEHVLLFVEKAKSVNLIKHNDDIELKKNVQETVVMEFEQKYPGPGENVEGNKTKFHESSIMHGVPETELEEMFVETTEIELEKEKQVESKNQTVQELLEPDSEQKYMQKMELHEKIDEEISVEFEFLEKSAENEGKELGKYMDNTDSEMLNAGNTRLENNDKYKSVEVAGHERGERFDQVRNINKIEENLGVIVMSSYVDNTVNEENDSQICVEKAANNAAEKTEAEEIRIMEGLHCKTVEMPAVKKHSLSQRKRAVKKGKDNKSIETVDNKECEIKDVESPVNQEHFKAQHAVVAEFLKEPEIVSNQSEEEAVDPDNAPLKRGHGRGRGRDRGHGRGAKFAQLQIVTQSTHSTRHTKAAEPLVMSIEIIDSDSESVGINQDCVVTVEDNKNSEMKSSVHNNNKPTVSSSGDRTIKTSHSPRVQLSQLKVENVPAEMETIASDDDSIGEASDGGSMQFGSDFEVVDDIEDQKLSVHHSLQLESDFEVDDDMEDLEVVDEAF